MVNLQGGCQLRTRTPSPRPGERISAPVVAGFVGVGGADDTPVSTSTATGVRSETCGALLLGEITPGLTEVERFGAHLLPQLGEAAGRTGVGPPRHPAGGVAGSTSDHLRAQSSPRRALATAAGRRSTAKSVTAAAPKCRLCTVEAVWPLLLG